MKSTWLSIILAVMFAVTLAARSVQAQVTEIQEDRLTSFGYNAGILGNGSTFYGADAGRSNTGALNSFVGQAAGSHNTTGGYNSFFGWGAGYYNDTGNYNSFFGKEAGFTNTEGYFNSFFGHGTGYSNITGGINSFFGADAGFGNTTGWGNSFFGVSAGHSNNEGEFNSFFGYTAGFFTTRASHNSFFGNEAGRTNTEGEFNSFFGDRAGFQNTTGGFNSSFGYQAGVANTLGELNSSFGTSAGYYNTAGSLNSFFGYNAGRSNTTEICNTFLGALSNGAPFVQNSTAIGYRAQVTKSNSLVLGSISGVNEDVNEPLADTFVGIGTTAPDYQLVVEGEQAVGKFRRYYGTEDPFTKTFAPAFLFERSRGIRSAPSDILPGDWLGKVQFRGRVTGLPRDMPEYGALAFIASDNAQNGRFSFIDRDLVTERMVILNTGNVGINTTAPLERLHVVGNVRIDGDLIWTDPGASVPDYVLDPNYNLMTIDELEKFIAEEKHLPNIPAATEIKDKGLNLSEFQMRLLEKIEELTLYTVQQAKSIEVQKAVLEQKDSKIAALDARLAALEQMMGRLAKQEK
jgi:trimeric autotransporter adhesin